MKFIDLHLKAENKEAVKAALLAAGFEEFDSVISHATASLDWVGTLHRETGEVAISEAGDQFPLMVAIDGYHVNVRTTNQELADKLKSIAVVVATPSRVWA